jgi:hypothetical protein
MPIIRQQEVRQGEPQEPEIKDSVGHRAGKRRCVSRPGGDGTLARLCAADGRAFILTRQEKTQLWLIISTSVKQQKFSLEAVRVGALNKRGMHYGRKGPCKGAPALPGQGDESAAPPTGFTVSCQVHTSAGSISALARHYKALIREFGLVKHEKTQLWIQKLTSRCGEVEKLNEALNERVDSTELTAFLIKKHSQAMAERENLRDYSLWAPAAPTADGYRPQTIDKRLARYRSHPPLELPCVSIGLQQRSCQFASTQQMDRRGNPPQISIDECIDIITDVDFLLSECKVVIELEAKLSQLMRQHHVLHDLLIAAHSAVHQSRIEQDHMAKLIRKRIFASMSSAQRNVGAEPPVFLATDLGSSTLPDPP